VRSRPTAWERRRVIVSVRHDWVNIAVSSANRANCIWGSRGMSAVYRVKRIGESTAPCGSPAVRGFLGGKKSGNSH
jgi:hypothetical protein